MECNIENGETQLIKRVKDYSYRERLEKIGLTTLLEKKVGRGDLTETFKIINGISNYGRHFFNISPWTGNLLSLQIFKKRSQIDLFKKYLYSVGPCAKETTRQKSKYKHTMNAIL